MKKITIPVFVSAILAGPAVHAQLQCPNDDVPTVNEVVFDTFDLSWLNSQYIPFYNEHFIIEDGLRGIEQDPRRRANKHMLGSLIALYGVAGTPPEPYFDTTTGQYEWPWAIGGTFHRSYDEYGPLTGGWGPHAFNQFDSNGDLVPGMRFHGGHRSRAVEPPNPNYAAVNRDFHDISPLPNRAIEYGCVMFNKPVFRRLADGTRETVVQGNDAVGFGEMMVHESWHSTGIGHTLSALPWTPEASSNQCQVVGEDKDGRPAPMYACDVYVAHGPGTHRGELAERQHLGMGAYQAGIQFSCDLAENPDDWVPMMVVLEADSDAGWRSKQPYFTNIGTFPSSCGVAENPFKAAAGLGQCSTSNAVCRDVFDCDMGETCDQVADTCDTLACLTDSDCRDAGVGNFCYQNCCDTIK